MVYFAGNHLDTTWNLYIPCDPKDSDIISS